MWIRNLRIEAELTAKGIKFEWHDEIPLKSIDIKGSLANNARLGAQLIDEHVLKLGIAIQNNMPMDGPVLRKRVGKTLLSVMAGNHRMAAAQAADQTTIGAYVVICDDVQANMFIRSDNRKGGVPQPDTEADEHIHFLNVEMGVPVAEAAREFSRPQGIAQSMIRAKKCRKELEDAGVDTDKLQLSSINLLNQLRHNKDVMVRAASIASVYDMTHEDIDRMVHTTSAQRSHVRQLAALEVVEKSCKLSKPLPRKSKAPTKSRLFNILSAKNGLLKILNTGSGGKPIKHINEIHGFDVDDAVMLLNLWEQIDRCMQPLLGECQHWIKQNEDVSRVVSKAKKKSK